MQPVSFDECLVLAPAGTLERRYLLATAMDIVKPGGRISAVAPKNKGGLRLKKELQHFGAEVHETAQKHQRLCHCVRPVSPHAIDEALAEGGMRFIEPLGLWSQPGIFSWDRVDPGSALLLEHLPLFSGSGADFGCGAGVLARAVLASPKVERLALIDIDRRAIDAAERNVTDPRARFLWADLRVGTPVSRLDFVVMNPPFHHGGTEDRSLGQHFIARAAESLRSGGRCWITANRHMPYEAELDAHFKTVRRVAEDGGYKLYEAAK